MRIHRLVQVLLCAGLLLPAGAPQSAPGRVATGAPGKPEGPVEVRLEGLPVADQPTSVSVELRPRRDLTDLRWRWVLSPGLHLLDGAMEGRASGARGEPTRLEARLLAPSGRGMARLVVSAGFPGVDATGAAVLEGFEVVRTLTWGAGEPDAPRVATRDADGRPVEVVAVPAAHEPGR